MIVISKKCHLTNFVIYIGELVCLNLPEGISNLLRNSKRGSQVIVTDRNNPLSRRWSKKRQIERYVTVERSLTPETIKIDVFCFQGV